MEKKRISDEFEPGPLPPTRPLDRFGFVKQEQSFSPEGLTKSRSAYERERYDCMNHQNCYFLNMFDYYSIAWDDA